MGGTGTGITRSSRSTAFLRKKRGRDTVGGGHGGQFDNEHEPSDSSWGENHGVTKKEKIHSSGDLYRRSELRFDRGGSFE